MKGSHRTAQSGGSCENSASILSLRAPSIASISS
jgi:hypothetical protein